MGGKPPQLSMNQGDFHSAAFYADVVDGLRKKMLKHDLLKPSPEDSPEVITAKAEVRGYLGSIESAQFLLCEWSKIVSFLLTGNITYLRHYWANAELQHPDTRALSDDDD